LRDVALLGSLPNCTVIQPGSALESRQALRYAVNVARGNVAIRLAIGPSPRVIPLPASYELTFGRGVELSQGVDAALLAYGPVMLHEALVAHELLARRNVSLRVINVPWLNRVDGAWLAGALSGVGAAFVLEDHGPTGGLGDHVLPLLLERDALPGRRLEKFAVDDYPACGTPTEALRHHRLDGASLARRIVETLESRK
jgi:transketolase